MDNKLALHIGKAIRARRKALKMSVEQLAELMKVKPYSVYRWEQGASTPPLPTLQKIASALNCSVSVILEPNG